jgi:chaperone required for assembly of F1-ATPase
MNDERLNKPNRDPASGPSEPNPLRAVSENGRPVLPKRFYRDVSVARQGNDFEILLDAKAVRTPARRPLAAPTRPLAEALAAEWSRQGERIDPASMPLTRLFNSAIDGVADRFGEVEADVLRYAGSDLICYRAAEPKALAQAQATKWDPLVEFARKALGARLVLAEGLIFAPQPPEALEAIAGAVRAYVGEGGAESNLKLASLHMMTALTGSCVIALAVALGRLGVDEAWACANVDQDFQMASWGEDAEALARREAHLQDLRAAALVSRAFAA